VSAQPSTAISCVAAAMMRLPNTSVMNRMLTWS
jgi:hypothetical protein